MDSDECYCRKNAQGFAAIGIGLQVLYLRYRYGMVANRPRTVAPPRQSTRFRLLTNEE